MKGLRSALDGIRRHTRNRLFIDQLNVVYNSPGFKAHARLLDAEMDRFLDQAAVYIANETLGYALWAYKDYYQNLLYNPSFSWAFMAGRQTGRFNVGRAALNCEPEQPCGKSSAPSAWLRHSGRTRGPNSASGRRVRREAPSSCRTAAQHPRLSSSAPPRGRRLEGIALTFENARRLYGHPPRSERSGVGRWRRPERASRGC